MVQRGVNVLIFDGVFPINQTQYFLLKNFAGNVSNMFKWRQGGSELMAYIF